VTVPSQRRYVHYFAHFLRLGQTTPRPQDVLFLKKIEIFGLSPKGHKGIEKYDPWIAICQRGRTACYAKDYVQNTHFDHPHLSFDIFYSLFEMS
jgi:hypothetical protein